MNHFRALGHIDTMRVANGTLKQTDIMEPVLASPAKVLELRRTANADGTGDIVASPALKDWINMRKLLAEVQRISGTPMLGLAYVEMLPPGATVDWKREEGAYFEQHWRLHLPIATNPGCQLLSGGEVYALPVGMLTVANVLVPHCATNFGATPRYHLVVDVERAQPESAQQ